MSLQKQLLTWITTSLLCVAVLAGSFAFFKTYHDLNKFQHDNLKNIAMLFASAPPPRRPINRTLNPSQDKKNRLARRVDRIEHLRKTQEERRDYNKPSIGLNNHLPIDTTQETIESNDVSAISQFDSKSDGQIRVHVIPLPLEYLNPNHLKRIQSLHLLNLPEGFGKMDVKGEYWRSFRLNMPDRIIIVRQKQSLQEKLAKAGAIQAFMPVLVGILLLLVLLPWLLNRMFKPVRQLSKQVANRDEQDLSAIDIGKDGKQVAVPVELQPLVTETNQLLGRVNKHIKQQQRFVADSAHELRSPLTAISLQVQRLQRLAKPNDLTVAQAKNIREGIDKLAVRVSHNQHLVEQLLTLARIDAQQLASSKTDLMAVLTQAVLLLLPIADNKQIELEVNNQLEGTKHNLLYQQVNIDETSLMMVLKNLLQNAILYTPASGQVTVSITDSHTLIHNQPKDKGDKRVGITHDVPIENLVNQAARLVVQICDTGVGIAPKSYKEVFTPFVRISDGENSKRSDTSTQQSVGINGTGLGLAIVYQICQQAGVDIYLSPTLSSTKSNDIAEQGKGLTVTLVFA